MPSPFPGMNPYLEQDDVWHDFHERFLPAAADLLNQQAGPNYIVKLDEHPYVHAQNGQRALIGRGDNVVSRGGDSPRPASAAAVLEAPAWVDLVAGDVEGENFLEIRDRRSRQVVTVLELLSPTNKYAGPNREQYLSKRSQVLAGNVHLVEIDLLRGGPRMPMNHLPSCAYCAIVSRWEHRPRAEAWPLQLRDRLPVLPIPLRAPDADLYLDLQALLHRVYDAAGYAKYIYDTPPHPLLRADDAAWASDLVAGI